jgi:hypothetical protein
MARSRGLGDVYKRQAVESSNTTACISFEKYRGRGPFVFGGRRLHVGSVFEWAGVHNVIVTSFADDGLSLIACTYKDGARRVVDKRMRITLDELKIAEKGRAANDRLAREVSSLSKQLQRVRHPVPDAQIAAWSPKERKAVEAWCKRRLSSDGKEAPPPVVLAARSSTSVAAE